MEAGYQHASTFRWAKKRKAKQQRSFRLLIKFLPSLTKSLALRESKLLPMSQLGCSSLRTLNKASREASSSAATAEMGEELLLACQSGILSPADCYGGG